MRNFGFATIIATALTAGAIGIAAPAIAAPTGTGNAQATISNLESQGYRVIVNRLSQSPLAQANVVSVGAGPTFTHTDKNARANQGYTDRDSAFSPNNVRTVYVNVR